MDRSVDVVNVLVDGNLSIPARCEITEWRAAPGAAATEITLECIEPASGEMFGGEKEEKNRPGA